MTRATEQKVRAIVNLLMAGKVGKKNMASIDCDKLPLDYFDDLVALQLRVTFNTWDNWASNWGEGMDVS
mgnify:CR=1 FL=1